MPRLINSLEKSLAFGFLLLLLGIPGVFFLDAQNTQHSVLRFISCFFSLAGWLWFHGALFLRWNRNRRLPRTQNNSGAVTWEWLLVIVLWLGVLPFAFLWLYHHLERLRSPV